jgi:hypothetical protein
MWLQCRCHRGRNCGDRRCRDNKESTNDEEEGTDQRERLPQSGDIY